ncbi:phage head-tail connector protein [Pediococcus pentosaceus]|uniref:phage head-tail connector protein n=1 Tax=Pediococcus pentosaceus TaxID=1255 RepID=UPI00191AB7E4|nr:phage head-tail connector protein [Pediococcus pentosaceus]QQT98020.1 phage head-tail connector protein [Pediococcus pentosaceus]
MEKELEKLKLYLGIGDKEQDELLCLLIEDCKARLNSYINQDGVVAVTLPESLSWIVRELTIQRFNRIGDEGKTSSSESDVSASWNDDDLAEYIKYLDPIRVRRSGRGIARFI